MTSSRTLKNLACPRIMAQYASTDGFSISLNTDSAKPPSLKIIFKIVYL